MPPTAAEEALYNDLLAIYSRAGAEVTYETDRGETRAYWAKRFLQAVKRANRNDELFEFVDRLIRAEEVSRGFLILKKADRLDLTVEALVSDATKPYHGEFDFEVVQTAKARLADHGHDVLSGPPAQTAAMPPGNGPAATTPQGPFVPGTTVDVRVSVRDDGSLSFALI